MEHNEMNGIAGQPLVSVAIPVYNVELYLRECLDSICGQTYTNLEIILVDDGSKDSSGSICDEYAAKDSRVICIHKANGGLSSARNYALDRASGAYIMFVDSDDWIDRDTVEYVLRMAISENADIVMWNYIREYENKSIPAAPVFLEKTVWNGQARDVYLRVIGPLGGQLANPATLDSLSSAAMKLYRTDMIRESGVRFVDHAVIGSCEDTLFHIQLFKSVKCAVYDTACLYHYRKTNSGSITHTYNPQIWSQRKRMFELAEMSLDDSDTQAKEALRNRVACSLVGMGLMMIRSISRRESRKGIRNIMHDPVYRDAVKQLRIKSMPIHWKLFYLFAKWNCIGGVCLLLRAIQYLKGRV